MLSAAHRRTVKAEHGRAVNDHLRKLVRLQKFSKRRTPWQDLRESISEAGAYKKWQNLLSYIRRFRTVSFFLRIVSGIFTFLQTGTLVVLTTAILFVLLPLLLLSLGILLLLTARDLRRSARRLLPQIGDKAVYVFFSVGGFGIHTARELAQNGAVVLILSDDLLPPLHRESKRLYLNLWQESNGVFFVRRHFYLHIKKKLRDTAEFSLIF